MTVLGAIYEEKLKHCNNLLHWLPFEMMNDDKDVTAFYPRDNLQLRQYACNGGHHCLEKAPLFSILSKYILIILFCSYMYNAFILLYRQLRFSIDISFITVRLYTGKSFFLVKIRKTKQNLVWINNCYYTYNFPNDSFSGKRGSTGILMYLYYMYT